MTIVLVHGVPESAAIWDVPDGIHHAAAMASSLENLAGLSKAVRLDVVGDAGRGR